MSWQEGMVTHPGPLALSSWGLALLVAVGVFVLIGDSGGWWPQFGHAAVVFTPTSLERGGARWVRVVSADLGDMAVGST